MVLSCLISIIMLGLSMDSIIAIIKYIFRFMIFTIIYISIDYLSTRKLPQEAINLHQEREIQIKGDYENVFEQCLHIMEKWKSIKSIKQIKEQMMISALTKMTIYSNAEEITMQFDISNKQLIKIHIKSQPVGRHALMDFGKNYRNVEWIKEKIESGILVS